jgi:hypothetical protein
MFSTSSPDQNQLIEIHSTGSIVTARKISANVFIMFFRSNESGAGQSAQDKCANVARYRFRFGRQP